jgi:hypothetical protein
MQGKFGRRYGDRSLAPVNMVSCVGVWENVWIEGIDGVFWRLACCTVQYSTVQYSYDGFRVFCVKEL